ncbi:MAG: thiol reductase thioredoxin [Deltaproteobacteria bacterium]|nr:thiol reductase thioredoxin [Deltaproteobacteria bacterium]
MSKSRNILDIKGKQQFEREVLGGDLPVVVDFWAPWCQPCKMQAPVFAAAAADYLGRVRFAKVNTEAVPGLAAALRIASIPSLLVFDGGKVIDARIGLTGRGPLDTMLRRALDRHQGVGFWARLKRVFVKGEPPAAQPARQGS